MPSIHNHLTEKFPMSLTIKNVIPYQEFSFYLNAQQLLLSFNIGEECNGVRVTINSAGFDDIYQIMRCG
jgi:hypothetical protein